MSTAEKIIERLIHEGYGARVVIPILRQSLGTSGTFEELGPRKVLVSGVGRNAMESAIEYL